MIAHMCAKHAPGTSACYIKCRCRCDECRAVNNQRERQRRYRKVYETLTPGAVTAYVDGDLVRAHLNTLAGAGMGWKRIAEVSGVGATTVGGILYGVHPNDPQHPCYRPPRRKVTRAVADKLLAVTPSLAPSAIVDSTGTARRLQALAAIGWPSSHLAQHLGIHSGNFTPLIYGTRPVTVATRDAVAALYDRLWGSPPTATDRYRAAAIERAKKRAEKLGWVPPLAWDDDEIDNPDARPNLGAREYVTLLDQVAELAGLGCLLPEIAHRLGRDERRLLSYITARNRDLAEKIAPRERERSAA